MPPTPIPIPFTLNLTCTDEVSIVLPPSTRDCQNAVNLIIDGNLFNTIEAFFTRNPSSGEKPALQHKKKIRK
jgi:hypothetical protein